MIVGAVWSYENIYSKCTVLGRVHAVNHEYFVVKISLDSLAYAKIKHVIL